MMRLNWPNRITLLRLLGVPVFVLLVMGIREEDYGRVYRILALAMFLAMGLSDLLDGWLARHLGQRTRLGAVLDPLADKMLLSIGCILLAFPEVIKPPLPRWFPVIVVSRDLFIIVGSVVLYLLVGRLYVKPTRLGRLCTLTLVLTVVAELAVGLLPIDAQVSGRRVLWGLTHAGAALAVASGLHYGWIGIGQLGEAAHEPEDPPHS